MSGPRCDDCGRARLVLAVTESGRYCGECVDWTIAARMKAARNEGRRK